MTDPRAWAQRKAEAWRRSLERRIGRGRIGPAVVVDLADVVERQRFSYDDRNSGSSLSEVQHPDGSRWLLACKVWPR